METSNPNSQGPIAFVPKVLLTDTDRRAYAARLALVLSEAGCEVSAICSNHGHPLLKTRVVRQLFSYNAFRPLASLRSAILEVKPTLIVPCDDRGVQHLHELHASAQDDELGAWLKKLIERSLGSAQSFGVVLSRHDLLQLASEEGLRVPRTEIVRTANDLDARKAKQPFPWVLKADETWGGRGVRIAHSQEEAARYLSDVSRPFRLRRAIKRALVNRDPFWLQPWWEGRKPAVIVQAHVQGHPANCAVVCWEGKVLAGIAVEVVSSDGLTGPASVVRVVDNSQMMLCAERIARRLNLSGFFGLDFMIEDQSHNAYLIEMNPRTTPPCHLRLGKGRDMVGALWAQLSGRPDPNAPPITENDLIAYFPQALQANSEYLASSFHDVPQGDAALMQEFLQPWPERSFLFRINNYLQHWKDSVATALTRKHAGYSGSRT